MLTELSAIIILQYMYVNQTIKLCALIWYSVYVICFSVKLGERRVNQQISKKHLQMIHYWFLETFVSGYLLKCPWHIGEQMSYFSPDSPSLFKLSWCNQWYLIYIQIFIYRYLIYISCKILGWINHKLESRSPGEI